MLPGSLYSFAARRNKLKMKKILSVQEAINIAKKIKNQRKTIVLAGGVFDILHLGHIKFLENSKKHGDYLFLLLEDDTKARKEKGKGRPIHSQKDRAEILSSLQSVDYIVLLTNMTNNIRYDKIIFQIRPNVIAATYKDPYVEHKKRQAKLINGKVKYVIARINKHSTSKYLKLITK